MMLVAFEKIIKPLLRLFIESSSKRKMLTSEPLFLLEFCTEQPVNVQTQQLKHHINYGHP